jgi:hypothetical protein
MRVAVMMLLVLDALDLRPRQDLQKGRLSRVVQLGVRMPQHDPPVAGDLEGQSDTNTGCNDGFSGTHSAEEPKVFGRGVDGFTLPIEEAMFAVFAWREKLLAHV